MKMFVARNGSITGGQIGLSLQPKGIRRRINNINGHKAEMSTMSENNWAVFRQDFHGNEFLVEQGLSESRARERVIEFESHKHHQHYWAAQIDSSAIDYVHLLRKQLANASAIESAIGVLINQGASREQCINALCQCRGIEAKDAMKLIEKVT